MTTSMPTRILFCLAELAALGWLTASAQAIVIEGGSDQLPNPAESYVSGAQVGFDSGTGGIIIIGGFEWTPLDGSGLQGPQPHLGGGWEVDSFFDITFRIDFLGGPDTKTGMGRGHVMGDGIDTSPSVRSFDTEMLMLELSGSGFMLRESPTKASTGQSMIQELSGGRFGIDSFFDVFTELSLDGGQTWLPADGAMRMTTIPEPSSLVLAAVTFAGLAAWGWRKRSHT